MASRIYPETGMLLCVPYLRAYETHLIKGSEKGKAFLVSGGQLMDGQSLFLQVGRWKHAQA